MIISKEELEQRRAEYIKGLPRQAIYYPKPPNFFKWVLSLFSTDPVIYRDGYINEKYVPIEKEEHLNKNPILKPLPRIKKKSKGEKLLFQKKYKP